MSNNSNQHTFSINYTSEDTGDTFSGQFTSKRQSILDKTRIQRRKSELAGGMYCVRDDKGQPTGQGIDEDTEWFNFAVAILEVTLIAKPTWWDFENLADEGVVLKVYEEVMKHENSFRRRTGPANDRGERVASSSETGAEEHQESVNANLPKKVVDGQVQASLD